MVLQRIIGNWAKCVEDAKARGLPLASAKEGIQDRMAPGNIEKHLSGAWFPLAFVNLGEKIYGVRKEFNPLIPYAAKAVEAHRTGEFYLTDEIVDATGKPFLVLIKETAGKDKNKRDGAKRVIDLGQAVTHAVSTANLAQDRAIVFVAESKRLANDYGPFLKNDLPENLRRNDIMVYHMKQTPQTQNAVRGFWLCGLDRDDRSDFGCGNGDLADDSGSVFGGSFDTNTSEASAQKISRPKVRISKPSFSEIRAYARRYVPTAVQPEFFKGLGNFWKQK
jgi:hypothetical protein